MSAVQIVVFMLLVVLLGVALKLKFPFKKKWAIKLVLVTVILLGIAYALEIPLIPQGAFTTAGLQPPGDGPATIKAVFEKIFQTDPAKQQIIFQQPKEPTSEGEKALSQLMKEYNIPEQRKEEFSKKAEEVVNRIQKDRPLYRNDPPFVSPTLPPKEYKNEKGQTCSERVVTQCS